MKRTSALTIATLGTALVAGLAARIVWVTVFCRNAYPSLFDDFFYFQGGINIARGLGFSFDGHPVHHFPPGYPYTLAFLFSLLGPHLWVAQALNIALGIAILALAFACSLKMFGSGPAAAVGAMFVFLLPEQIMNCALVRSELILTALVLALVLLLLSDWHRKGVFKRCGLAISFAAVLHVRPECIVIPGVFMAAQCWRDRTAPYPRRAFLRDAVVVYGLALLLTVPWNLHLYRLKGRPYFMSTAAASTFAVGNSNNTAPSPERTPGFNRPYDSAMRFVRQAPVKITQLFWPNGGIGNLADYLILDTVPRVLTSNDVDEALAVLGQASPRKAWITDLLKPRGDGLYEIDRTASDEAISMFGCTFLYTYTYQYPTPPFFVPARHVYAWSRMLITVLGALAILLCCLHPALRRQFAGTKVEMLGWVFLAQLAPYAVFLGRNRYATPWVAIGCLLIAFLISRAAACSARQPDLPGALGKLR